ncbi:MAG: DinB family protein [Planctomycetes bacterium]|nr:DinB family protein [Planctomycetota bacterium]
MTTKEVIKNTIDTGQFILTTYLSDMADADLLVRPVPGANHAAWQLGHLVASEFDMMSKLGYRMPALPDGFAESYTKETTSSDDPAKFHTKEQYVAWLQEQRGGTLAALEGAAEADLDKPSPESMRDYAPTVGVAFNLIGIHLNMHAAQLAVLRRKLDKPVLI